MKKRFLVGLNGILAMAHFSPALSKEKKQTMKEKGRYMGEKIEKTEAEWKKTLTPEQFQVLRKHGTEHPFKGKYWDNHEKGIYVCAACGLELFPSETKYDSGTGWPSFYQPIYSENVATKEDNTLFTRRTEVHCPRCGGHLGHVFD